ncbi:MAG: lytic transglycosylase domain-containing protein, partial [Polyangiales bacterium]
SQAAAQRARTRAAQQAIQRVRRGRPLTRLKEVQLVHVVRLAAPAGLTREVNVALHMLQRRRRLHPRLALRAAIAAAGVGEDARIVALLTRARTRYPRKVPSALRYHRARALERSGKLSKACAAYDDLSHDSHAGDYYRIWAKARLQSLTTSSSASECKPPRPFEAVAASGLNQVPSLADIEALTTPLRALAKRHAKAYPWLKRAADLIDLGEFALAADEMHEAYLAWRAARGRTLRGAGLEAVYRGTARTRRYVPWKLKRARRALSEADVRLLAKAARRLGDMGTAVGFAGQAWLRQRPRAYRAQVHQAAQAHGLDPNLLFAVMRVESIYHRRIVSYAGAVGLMQIMPGTGRRIAQQLEMRDFNTAALLEPHTNLRFAAWYLASLLERFDGRLPLAIASYNGGPHNVRQWMQNQSPDMPLDAFLERIPFTQTHRYVRRVLTHYAAYRAQEGLAVPELHLKLPAIKPDDVAF